MSQVKILTVEHQSDGGLRTFGDRLAELGADITVVGPDVGKDVPENLDGYDALIVLGGSMGPLDDDRAPWLPATRNLLKKAHETNLPTLGVCLGAQLLVTVLGGKVAEMPAGPELGLQSVDFKADTEDPLFGNLSGTVPVVQWHWLEAAELPAGTEVLASSAACQNQAFRVSERAWGVQFHPEGSPETVEAWATADARSLVDLGIEHDDVVEKAQANRDGLKDTWGNLADRFIAIAAEAK